ncbi:hypothetical protein Ddye_016831 [Dipteronia dyeriana]|uniref:Uncharacterized protein n=1 Tax=Dipteronia dyeriana TaxID=168575 RepID=A0AAD9U7L2_9ROSI|nr:hypothetical protein Ddye_016831 [Dipteronia dyeriana]
MSRMGMVEEPDKAVHSYNSVGCDQIFYKSYNSAVDLDVLFLHDFTPDKPFINVFEVSRVRLNFGSATGTVDSVLHWICKLG